MEKQTIFTDNIDSALELAAPRGATVYAPNELRSRVAANGYIPVDNVCDALVILALGDNESASAAREKAARRDCKLVLLPRFDLAMSALAVTYTVKGGFAAIKNSIAPDVVALVSSQLMTYERLYNAFGQLCALDLGAFDMTFAAHMNGEPPDFDFVKQIAEQINALISDAAPTVKDHARLSEVICRHAEPIAKLISTKPLCIYGSGTAQMYEALRMLFAAENRPMALRGETEFLCAGSLIDYYLAALNAPPSTVPNFPPDNCRRIDAVCEYFKTDIRLAAAMNAPVFPPLKMRIAEYRSNEFKNEYLNLLNGIKLRYARALPVFKHIHRDDGYSLKNLFESTDVSLCLALAPDVFPSGSMLSFYKQTGELDKYII